MPNPRIMKAITVDAALAIRAKEEGINFSRLMDSSLTALFGAQDGIVEPSPEEIAAKAAEARLEEIRDAIVGGAQAVAKEREVALIELQSNWNKYMAQGPKPVEAKLSWIRAHISRHPGLRTTLPEALLKELEG